MSWYLINQSGNFALIYLVIFEYKNFGFFHNGYVTQQETKAYTALLSSLAHSMEYVVLVVRWFNVRTEVCDVN
jgi:hypothetical protein